MNKIIHERDVCLLNNHLNTQPSISMGVGFFNLDTEYYIPDSGHSAQKLHWPLFKLTFMGETNKNQVSN